MEDYFQAGALLFVSSENFLHYAPKDWRGRTVNFRGGGLTRPRIESILTPTKHDPYHGGAHFKSFQKLAENLTWMGRLMLGWSSRFLV